MIETPKPNKRKQAIKQTAKFAPSESETTKMKIQK
jgi:hypothetical protein